MRKLDEPKAPVRHSDDPDDGSTVATTDPLVYIDLDIVLPLCLLRLVYYLRVYIGRSCWFEVIFNYCCFVRFLKIATSFLSCRLKTRTNRTAATTDGICGATGMETTGFWIV